MTIEPENLTSASMTFQNYFRLYKKLAGMTGTAATEADEFCEIYKLDVIEVPTNMPVIRKARTTRSSARPREGQGDRRRDQGPQPGQPMLVGTARSRSPSSFGDAEEAKASRTRS